MNHGAHRRTGAEPAGGVIGSRQKSGPAKLDGGLFPRELTGLVGPILTAWRSGRKFCRVKTFRARRAHVREACHGVLHGILILVLVAEN